MLSVLGYEIKPTIFPDKTSQVWKLPEELISMLEIIHSVEIKWNFEHEAELIHLAQLYSLLKVYITNIHLTIPFFPYSRQDKKISNDNTFALYSFCNLLGILNFKSIITYDVHNPEVIESEINLFKNIIPIKRIKQVLNILNCNNVCFPDSGSYRRYLGLNEKYNYITFSKVRNQITGIIERLELNEGYSTLNQLELIQKDFLIVDDICDGGKTFELTAKQLYNLGANNVYLYVSHGLFTKGLNGLKESGIKEIYTFEKRITL